ncbi:MAG TPA: cobalamin-binding protein [Cellvibrionaceae bacterium]|nr:cobalamin-binding protein [Cellvibrionaceae bacterium]HNG61285.1 cobalamin-binding protein [Cellvibrionaceae bacterium]
MNIRSNLINLGRAVIAALLLLLIVTHAHRATAGAQISAVDARGKTLIFTKRPERIISLAPSITELLFSAGAETALVGTVDFSDYPAAALKIPRVGSYASFDYEAIVKLQPDLIIGWQSGNPAEKIAHLERLGLRVLLIEPHRLADLIASVHTFAQLAGNSAQAQASIDAFNQIVTPWQKGAKPTVPVRVFYQIWHQPLMTLNKEHLFNELLTTCGGENVFGDLAPLAPKIDIEAVLKANPDLIIASGMDTARPQWLDQWHQWPQLKAVKNGHLFFIPPDLLQRQSLRAADGLQQLCTAIDKATRKSDGEKATR